MNAYMATDDDIEGEPREWVGPATYGAACLFVGLLMLFNIEAAVGTIVVLTAVSLILSAIGDVVLAEERNGWTWLSAGVLFLAGVAALLWPNATLWVLAVIVGIGFIISGVAQMVSAFTGPQESERTVLAVLAGFVTATVGLVSLVWPEATVFVIAVLFGFRIMLVGVVSLMTARRLRNEYRGHSEMIR